MNNRKILVISGLAAIAVIAIISASFANNESIRSNQPTQISGNLSSPPPVPITQVIARQQVPDGQSAQSIVGYAVKAPTSLPATYRTQIISVDSEHKVVSMLASPIQIKQNVTTNVEFFNIQKGILVYMADTRAYGPSFDKNIWLTNWAADRNATISHIGGFTVAAHGITTYNTPFGIVQDPAEVVLLKGYVEIELRGMVNSSDLMNAVASML